MKNPLIYNVQRKMLKFDNGKSQQVTCIDSSVLRNKRMWLDRLLFMVYQPFERYLKSKHILDFKNNCFFFKENIALTISF